MASRDIVALVNYPSQKNQLRDFFEHYEVKTTVQGKRSIIKPYLKKTEELAREESKWMMIKVDDLLAHLKYEGGSLPPGREEKSCGLLSTILHNGPRALRLCYEVIEEMITELFVISMEDESALTPKERIWRVIRRDGSVPACFRVPYELYLYPPKEWYRKQQNNALNLALHQLRGVHVGHLLELRGLVSRVCPTRPCIQVAVYRCEDCFTVRYQHVDTAGVSYMPLKQCQREQCQKKNNTLSLSSKDSKYINYQQVWIQENPENVPSSKVPHQLKLIVTGDTTNQIRPGRPIRVGGFFVLQLSQNAGRFGGGVSDHSAPVFQVIYVEQDGVCVDQDAMKKKAEFAKANYPGHRLYELMAKSIAPTIHGHDDVKKAMLLQLVGGVGTGAETEPNAGGDDSENIAPNGNSTATGNSATSGNSTATGHSATGVERDSKVKLRGSIHMLLLGDPGIAKSQLLLRMCDVSPRSKYTCGKGASGVGLTACVTKDTITGEFSLEAGATVLADRGLCCIDEFDKMNEQDRTAIHEVMEQQTVSISKAGIVATLNARCSVLAAANPVGGRYNVRKTATENIGLPAALLSRFDLVFLLLDQSASRQHDIDMARHLLAVRKTGTNFNNVVAAAGNGVGTGAGNGARGAHGRGDNAGNAHGGVRPQAGTLEPGEVALETEVIKLLVEETQQYAPTLPAALEDEVTARYVAARRTAVDAETYVTPRSLTGLLRLAQALAKLRFDTHIALEDVEEAQRLIDASRESVRRRRAELQAAHIDKPYLKTLEFIQTLSREGAAVDYTHALQQAAEQGIEPGAFNDALEDLINQGQITYTDITKQRFVKCA
ncbi:putative DNA replication licensing factor MCM7 [Gregarina niphandrodes]|uniref:DNA replication licensing factor MCM7 n=1 Tax=Gregarina niphandrodes TaxID=110365 RepID=A0A023B4W6_GRENI|nr:putative DNA replication licensing factor MCM7 [Gregarina niphandrodes]EZG57771.1 putative DNA replication licensing factor MCM7 [Gregarina niphandrodes]|eukprot:XP_011131035.1 putative DNA replication licensing factor MCM7 [Gregarina niphandrodes]